MLTGDEIKRAHERGDIQISPFNNTFINPNSYNVRLDVSMCIYVPQLDGTLNYDWHPHLELCLEQNRPFPKAHLDAKIENPVWSFNIPSTGLMLYPDKLYLGNTIEAVGSSKYIPRIDGRSSVGRLGICIHQTAGVGDLGFHGTWTLEITCIEPVRIYAGMRIGQVHFDMPEGDRRIQYDKQPSSKYNNQITATPSRMYKEMDAP